MNILKSSWYELNQIFGTRIYFDRDCILYIKEGFNKPEIFTVHLREKHPEQYINYMKLKQE